MDAEQLNLFDALFPQVETNGTLCENMNEAVLNDCGVFTTYKTMFQGGSYSDGSRVVISIAKRSPFIYYAFSCETRIQGRSHPCTVDPSARFNVSDKRENVLNRVRQELMEFCEGIDISNKNIEKALNDMEHYL